MMREPGGLAARLGKDPDWLVAHAGELWTGRSWRTWTAAGLSAPTKTPALGYPKRDIDWGEPVTGTLTEKEDE